MQEAQVGLTGLVLTSFQQPFDTEQITLVKQAADLLVDLRPGRAGAKVAVTTILLHKSSPDFDPYLRGSLVSATLRRYVKRLNKQTLRAKAYVLLLNLVNKLKGTFIANIDDIRPQFRSDDNVFLSQNAIFQGTLVRDNGIAAGATIDQLSGQRMDSVSGLKEEAKPWYSDQILPFDITLAGTNEMGAATAMKIFGVEILNEGSGMSIDDAVQEMQATFVARFVEPWQAVQSKFTGSAIGGGKL